MITTSPNLFGPQLEAYQRRRAIADQMGQQASNTGATSPADAMSRILQAFLANKVAADASKQYAGAQAVGPMMARQLPGTPT